jgi:hypothetical protein
MPICKKCGKSFSVHLKTDGVKKHLRHRKNCFECSQYNKPNKEDFNKVGIECTCTLCGRIYFYNRKSGHSTKKCNSCLVNSSKEIKKKMAIFYKGGKCAICNYDKCTEALDFHHIEENKKEFTISGNHCLSWEKIKKEIEKCILVCCRCHREIHLNLFTENYIKEIYEKQKEEQGTHPTFIETEKIIIQKEKEKEKKTLKCECGKNFIETHKGQKYCSYECSIKYRRKIDRPNEEELKELIRNNTWVSIAKKYGVSDSAVRKWAKAYNLI